MTFDSSPSNYRLMYTEHLSNRLTSIQTKFSQERSGRATNISTDCSDMCDRLQQMYYRTTQQLERLSYNLEEITNELKEVQELREQLGVTWNTDTEDITDSLRSSLDASFSVCFLSSCMWFH